MKKALLALVLISCVGLSLSAQVKGPIVDVILMNTRTTEDIALKDVATGVSDLFYYTIAGPTYKAMSDADRAKTDPYTLTGATYHDIYMNPYPNAAPYTGTVGGKTVFNPFAIREVRFAMNYLVSRKFVIDEILGGAGAPMLTPVVPGLPNSSRFALIASKMGVNATGNEKKAIADITAAMEKAAALPENKGKMVKGAQFWTYNGEPITMKYLIRVDDPNVRLPMGRYIANQVEKAGIKVERLEYDRTKCSELWNASDPKDLLWNFYTGAWGGGGTVAFFEGNIGQMYAPVRGQMPGGNKAGQWSYSVPEIDGLIMDCINGYVKDSVEYYAKLNKATQIGLREAIRVQMLAQTSYTVANKDRFNVRMAYGFGDGINKYSMYTADVKPDASGTFAGKKVLRETAFSARGNLFMFPWDPIGTDGAGDTYSQVVIGVLGDPETNNGPTTGIPLPMTANWSGVKTDIKVAGTVITGNIKIPADAVLWNVRTGKWDSAVVYEDVKGDASEYNYVAKSSKPEFATAWSTATFTFKYGKWHHGRAITQADYRYAIARPFELSVKLGDDKVYEESYASTINPNLPRTRGLVFNKNGTITVYANANYPMDQPSLAALMCPTLLIQASNYSTYIPWEIHEATKYMVSEGAASKTEYVFNSNGDLTEIDLISEICVKDIKAKLAELITRKHIPASLVGFVTPADAVKGYQMAIDFITKYNHAYMSNGGFIMTKYDPTNNTAILTANRDPAYPFEKGYFTKLLTTSFMRIDAVAVGTYKKGTDLTVNMTLSEVTYPANSAKAAPKGVVKVTLIGENDVETVYVAKMVKAGSFSAVIPAKVLDALKAGSYTLVVEAALGTETASVETANVIVGF